MTPEQSSPHTVALSPERGSEQALRDRRTLEEAADASCILLVGGAAARHPLSSMLVGCPQKLVGPQPGERVMEVVGSGRAIGAALIDVDVSVESYDVVWQLAELEYPCRSILVGREIDESVAREGFLAGVVACLPKPVERGLLNAAMRNAIEGTRIARACLDSDARLPRREGIADRVAKLTRRERQVLDLVLAGRRTRAMAASLGVTERTVKYHVANILQKLEVKSRIALLAEFRGELTRVI